MLRLFIYYGQLRRAIPSPKKSPPFVPHGLHGLFCGFRTIHASLFFSVMFFAINPSFIVMFFSKTTISIHAKEKQKNTPEKQQPKAMYT